MVLLLHFEQENCRHKTVFNFHVYILVKFLLQAKQLVPSIDKLQPRRSTLSDSTTCIFIRSQRIGSLYGEIQEI